MPPRNAQRLILISGPSPLWDTFTSRPPNSPKPLTETRVPGATRIFIPLRIATAVRRASGPGGLLDRSRSPPPKIAMTVSFVQPGGNGRRSPLKIATFTVASFRLRASNAPSLLDREVGVHAGRVVPRDVADERVFPGRQVELERLRLADGEVGHLVDRAALVRLAVRAEVRGASVRLDHDHLVYKRALVLHLERHRAGGDLRRLGRHRILRWRSHRHLDGTVSAAPIPAASGKGDHRNEPHESSGDGS